MTSFTCYAIRQKYTGYFLPIRWTKSRGYSFDEPEKDSFPRLFKTKRSAQQALTAWLQGEWKEPEYEVDPDFHHRYIVGYSPIKKIDRSRDDMEVIEMILTPFSSELNLYLRVGERQS